MNQIIIAQQDILNTHFEDHFAKKKEKEIKKKKYIFWFISINQICALKKNNSIKCVSLPIQIKCIYS